MIKLTTGCLLWSVSVWSSTIWSVTICPLDARVLPPDAAARNIESSARAARGDVCPDRHASGGPADATILIEEIRRRAEPRLAQIERTVADLDPTVAQAQFKAMRLHLAARHADVRLEHGRFVIAPELKSSHGSSFAALAPLRPDENADLQRRLADRVRRANEQIVGQSRTVVGQVGATLRNEIRADGDEGYRTSVTAHPFLRFVERNEDVLDARDTYLKKLKAESAAIPKLKTDPPSDDALALIFFEAPTREALRAHPELCGAFNDLKLRARRNQRIADALRAGVDAVTSEALCGLVASLTNAVGLAFCLGQYAIKGAAIDLIPDARARERRALYGGY